MRGFTNYRGRAAALLLAATLAVMLGACGDDECNHVITDVPTFEQCQAIAVERGCSDEVTYGRANPNNGKPSRCKVENCNDCNGGGNTPTATPTLTPTAG